MCINFISRLIDTARLVDAVITMTSTQLDLSTPLQLFHFSINYYYHRHFSPIFFFPSSFLLLTFSFHRASGSLHVPFPLLTPITIKLIGELMDRIGPISAGDHDVSALFKCAACRRLMKFTRVGSQAINGHQMK